MRLIDLDKVRWKEGFYDMHTGEQFASMIFNTPEWLEWATAEAEVKAVPIEWIKNYAKRKASKGFTEIDCYWQYWEDDVLKMVADWEKENGEKTV